MSSSSIRDDSRRFSSGSIRGSISGSTRRLSTSRGEEDPPPPAKSPDELIDNVAKAAGFDENKAQLVKYSLMAVGALAIFKVVSESLFYIYVLFLPGIYAYLLSTCPKEESFDAKQELKKIMDGSLLAEGHPEKPRSFFGKLYSQAVAEVTTEYSAWMGMRSEFSPLAGMAIWVTVQVPTLKYRGHWIGALNKWYFVSGSTSTNGLTNSSTRNLTGDSKKSN